MLSNLKSSCHFCDTVCYCMQRKRQSISSASELHAAAVGLLLLLERQARGEKPLLRVDVVTREVPKVSMRVENCRFFIQTEVK
jgi:hypothetical protein